MTPATLPPDQRGVIAAHKHDTTLLLLAGPTVSALADRVQERIGKPRSKGGQAYGRPVQRVPDDDPSKTPRSDSWCLAVLVDGGFSLVPLLKWARRLSTRDQRRIQFLVPENIDPVHALEPWTELLPVPVYWVYPNVNGLIRQCLEQLNNQNYVDHAPGPIPGIA